MADPGTLEFLCSSQKIDRDRGVEQLKAFLTNANETQFQAWEVSLQTLLNDSQNPWETKHGALMGAKALLSTSANVTVSEEFSSSIRQHALKLLEDPESRVRLASG